MKIIKNRSAAFAPATIGNVSIGFDILGMAISGVGDIVELRLRKDSKVVIQSIKGVVETIPLKTHKNTAGAALEALIKGENLKVGFDVFITKGIPLGSGMGGSAASAVAAIVAASSMLNYKIDFNKQFYYAMEGEKVASGAAHPDNVAPCFKGGITLASLNFIEPVQCLPFPKNLNWVLVHPEIKVETKQARALLKKSVSLELYVEQSAKLSLFIKGLFEKDLKLIQQGFEDQMIEPQRAQLIPEFHKVKEKVLSVKGVLGFSISGSGPSVFALAESPEKVQIAGKLIQKEFKKINIPSQMYSGSGAARGARKISLSK